MADESLTISINGDPKGFQESLEQVKGASDNLQKGLNETAEAGKNIAAGLALEKMGEASKQVFSTLSEGFKKTIEAYADDEQAAKRLTNVLQNQGIFSEKLVDTYNEYADSIAKVTGLQAGEITKAEGVLQGFLGQIPVTKELTQAAADLAVKQGISVPQAAEMLGKAVGEGSGALLKMGLSFKDSDDRAERMAKTVEFATSRFGGFAATANTGVGSLNGFNNAIAEAESDIGKKFAPAVELAAKVGTQLINFFREHEALQQFVVIVGTTAAAVSGLVVGFAALGQAWIAIQSALAVLGVAFASTFGAIAIAVGAVIALGTALYLNWDTTSKFITEKAEAISVAVSNMADTVIQAFGGIGEIMTAIVTGDFERLKAGVEQVKDAFTSSSKEEVDETKKATTAIVETKKKGLTEVEIAQRDAANKAEAQRIADEAARKAFVTAQNQLIVLELKDVSAAQIDLKKKEIEILKALAEKKSGEDKALLKQQLSDIESLQKEQMARDLERDKAFAKARADLQQQGYDLDAAAQSKSFQAKERALKATQKTQADAHEDFLLEREKMEIDANNRELADREAHGKAYAAINRAMHSQIFEGTEKAAGELSQLQKSKSAEMREIGKAAAVAQILIHTAQAAMGAFSALSAIPIVGPILGGAAAAAIAVYGAEQVAAVYAVDENSTSISLPSAPNVDTGGGGQSAPAPAPEPVAEQSAEEGSSAPSAIEPGYSFASGGRVTGGLAGRDSVPAMLMPNELVVPKQSFAEVVDAFVKSKGYDKVGDEGGSSTRVDIGFDGPEASRVLTIRQNEDMALGISRRIS